MQGEYAREIEQLHNGEREQHRYDPRQRLADHILAFYWRGKTPLEDEGSLVNRLFANAPPALRAHAITFVGHSLRSEPEELDSALSERLTELWNKRIGEARSSGAKETFADEIAAFGWWFASRKFSDEWSIRALSDILAFSGKAEPDHLVVERLAELAPTHPLDAVSCLDELARGDKEGWGVYGWQGSASEIIRSALASADLAARAAAERLVDYLVRRGHRQFADVARGSQAPD